MLSFEALLRWQHPNRGLLGPDQFIGVLEETELINELSWWILRESAYQTRCWQKLFPTNLPLGISIDVTGKLFRNGGVAEKLLDMLADVNLMPQHMHLEITERSLMDHQKVVLTELDKLRSAGVQLHIDDFGTGYSSLSYLQRYSYDTLKIDRSFISEVLHPGDASAIVTLGKNLNMNIVAGG